MSQQRSIKKGLFKWANKKSYNGYSEDKSLKNLRVSVVKIKND